MTAETPRKDPETLLARVPLFAGLGRRELGKLAALCLPKAFPRGAVIIEEGKTGLGLFVIIDGRVEIVKGQGKGRVSLAVLEAGDILGEMALIDDHPRSATVVALDQTSCLLITRDAFHTLVKKNASVAWCIVPVLAERLRLLGERVAEQRSAMPPVPPAARQEPVPPEAEAERKPSDDGEPEEETTDGTEDRLAGLLRVEYALALAGVEGLSRSLEATRTFLLALGRETDMSDDTTLETVLRSLPDALRTALRDALTDGQKIPEQMLATFRRERRRD